MEASARKQGRDPCWYGKIFLTGCMEKAVQEFQREQKLEPDGVIGRDTWPKVLDVPVEAILGTHGWGNLEKEKIECHEKN